MARALFRPQPQCIRPPHRKQVRTHVTFFAVLYEEAGEFVCQVDGDIRRYPGWRVQQLIRQVERRNRLLEALSIDPQAVNSVIGCHTHRCCDCASCGAGCRHVC